MGPKTKAAFVEPMLCLAAYWLPEGEDWQYELKLDGYRALAIKTGSKTQFRSRNNKNLGDKFPSLVKALGNLPEETVIDGEIVALDESGGPPSTRSRTMPQVIPSCITLSMC